LGALPSMNLQELLVVGNLANNIDFVVIHRGHEVRVAQADLLTPSALQAILQTLKNSPAPEFFKVNPLTNRENCGIMYLP